MTSCYFELNVSIAPPFDAYPRTQFTVRVGSNAQANTRLLKWKWLAPYQFARAANLPCILNNRIANPVWTFLHAILKEALLKCLIQGDRLQQTILCFGRCLIHGIELCVQTLEFPLESWSSIRTTEVWPLKIRQDWDVIRTLIACVRPLCQHANGLWPLVTEHTTRWAGSQLRLP